MPGEFKRLIYKIVFNLALTSASLIIVLSIFYGRFPPPFAKIQAQIREAQNSNRESVEPQRAAEVPKAHALELAESAATGGEEALGDKRSQAEKAREKEKTKSPIRQETVRISASNNPTDAMAEIRQIRYKLQTLEARQQEMKQWMDAMRANSRNAAKTKKNQQATEIIE